MTGTYEHSIDAKNRLFIPAKLREELGVTFYLAMGVDACLAAAPMPGSQLAKHLADPDFHDHHDHFTNSTPESEWKSCLAHAEKIGLGSREYELITL